MAIMTVYHGGYMPVEQPQIRIGRNTKDFCTGESLKCLSYRGFEEVK